ncbi:hypothetical protein KAI87_10580, partial [Myxococcota bacterium]|nr:hypothetical protein [Myxococcota bacterium]
TYYQDASLGSILQIADRRAPAHDDLPDFRVNWSFRSIQLNFDAPRSALSVRNEILQDIFLDGAATDPDTVPPTLDPVYGGITCGTGDHCYQTFTLYVGAVQRLDRLVSLEGEKLVLDDNGDPVVVTVVALTPNDSEEGGSKTQAYDDRLTRIEDLTGGSALARYQAGISQTCEMLDQARAQADLIFVVDDSLSMQQVIERLQQAADDASSQLSANANIVDFRVAMTTTNPSRIARTRCPDSCDDECGGGSCSVTCADDTLGCIKICPGTCAADCTGCTGTNVCEVADGCTLEADFSTLLAAEESSYPLPGGGGTFYYEDTEYLDCLSDTGGYSDLYLNSCYTNIEFSPFYGGSLRQQLMEHAGFLGSGSASSCELRPMDLTYDTNATGSVCADDSEFCCDRLIAACDDGPTVLASQMCNLIREMGGLPHDVGGDSYTVGRRPHSAPEMGSRSARRLITSMLPALPSDYEQGTDGPLDPKEHLRLTCAKADEGCVVCDPRTDEGCEPVPLMTVFLSDEGDFWFKDDCAFSARDADKEPLPELCAWVDGDPTTLESCIPSEGDALYDANNPLAYCESKGFLTDPPTGYDPDITAWVAHGSTSLKWRDDDAPECSAAVADAAVSCLADPCPTFLDSNSCSGTGSHDFCVYNATQ